MGNIGDREALGKLVKMNDWNEYTVIARGGTFIHIVNGQLMAVMIDDDPNRRTINPAFSESRSRRPRKSRSAISG